MSSLHLKPVSIPFDLFEEVAHGLLELARLARLGQIRGVAVCVMDARGELRYVVLGAARLNHGLAHLGAARLEELLRWPDREYG